MSAGFSSSSPGGLLGNLVSGAMADILTNTDIAAPITNRIAEASGGTMTPDAVNQLVGKSVQGAFDQTAAAPAAQYQLPESAPGQAESAQWSMPEIQNPFTSTSGGGKNFPAFIYEQMAPMMSQLTAQAPALQGTPVNMQSFNPFLNDRAMRGVSGLYGQAYPQTQPAVQSTGQTGLSPNQITFG